MINSLQRLASRWRFSTFNFKGAQLQYIVNGLLESMLYYAKMHFAVLCGGMLTHTHVPYVLCLLLRWPVRSCLMLLVGWCHRAKHQQRPQTIRIELRLKQGKVK